MSTPTDAQALNRSARVASAFPGFDSPAVGFEQPFEMLVACHARAHCSLALLGRLIMHVDRHGHDANARSAASDVLRYFDIAAPLHHQDEELHVLPMLAGGDAAGLVAVVAALRADHARMHTLWSGLRPTLVAWSRPCASGVMDATARQRAAEFERMYAAHLQTEEGIVFPAARLRMDAARLHRMSADMQRRRQTGVALLAPLAPS
jgi:iron-sulfur cluster repair protein YtfE (RIC family)